ncbi:MAG TPA: metallophosphoesterase [Candidatus Dojkabacteria bacterium]|jgi:predicted phosphodiesterase
MKYLIISDIHLNEKFDKGKNKFLLNLIKDYENIVINGDLWEAAYVDIEKFKKVWNELLQELKKKNTTYLYGNHDEEQDAKKLAEYFASEKGLVKEIKSGEYKFHIEHGSAFYPNNGNSYISYKKPWRRLQNEIFQFVERIILKFNPSHDFNLGFNKVMKKDEMDRIPDDEILICGHSHAPEMNLKENYINEGFILGGVGNYLVIEDGKLDFKTEKY